MEKRYFPFVNSFIHSLTFIKHLLCARHEGYTAVNETNSHCLDLRKLTVQKGTQILNSLVYLIVGEINTLKGMDQNT